eukprot:scaffold3330_cov164-Amphora_coffeaeformis.AAC.21
MSDKEDEDNIFADSDSDNTADLFAQTEKAAPKKITKKKKPAPPKKKPPVDEGDDLFDSDSEDDEPKEKLSKKEKMAALMAKKKRANESSSPIESSQRKKREKDKVDGGEQKDGYESEDSIDSAQIERTAEDDNFIDTTGEDEEAVKEYYAKQHFDEELEDMEDKGIKKKRKYRSDEAIEDSGEPDNPLDAAMMRLKRKKREKKSTLELEDEVKEFVGRMEAAAEQDEEAVVQRRPGMKKLGMLNEVVDMMKKQDYQSYLIEFDLLSVIRRWIQPLPNGQLGNVTVRTKLLDAVANMPGIHPNALKRSELGKTVMLLHKHPKETPALKRQTRDLIEQWSRGIFQKSGDMRELEHVSRGEGSLAAIRRQQGAAAASSVNVAARRDKPGDLKNIITSGKRGGEAMPASANRVRVPFSKGFAYSVRPTAKVGGEMDDRRSPAKDSRGALTKRMLDKSKKVGKNQRSANISIEGRRTKG